MKPNIAVTRSRSRRFHRSYARARLNDCRSCSAGRRSTRFWRTWSAWRTWFVMLLYGSGLRLEECLTLRVKDVDFDRREALRSVPARFGVARALVLARLLHAGALVGLIVVGVLGELHPVYWGGIAAIGALLTWEHRLVRSDDLSRLGVAFFNMNGVISVLYLAAVLAAVLAPRS